MMASRYGRQKKRKALRQIQALQCENKRMIRENLDSKELMGDCLRVLGENFIGLPAKTLRCSLAGDFFRAPQELREQSVGYMTGREIADSLACIVHEIGAMRTEVRRDKIQKSVHFRVRHPETGELAYCVSRELMQEMPRGVLIKRISVEIAEQFSMALSKNT